MMSLVVKGFIANATKVNNNFSGGKGIISTYGELSPDSKTFAKELGFYPKSNTPLVPITFTCKDENNVKQVLPNEHIALIHDVAAWLYAQGKLIPVPTLNELIYKFNIAFSARHVTDVEFGEMTADTVDNLPMFVAFMFNADYIQFWFGDEWFNAQYDDYEHVYLPALDPVDDFWLAGSIVAQKLKLNDLVKHDERVQELRDGYPPTVVRTTMYEYFDPQNPLHIEKTYWTVLIYGPAGDNIDAIQDGLADYVLDHSTHTREEWITIIPDLFKRSEFYIVPQWDNIAIETTMTNDRGIYSAVSTTKKAIGRLVTIASEYSQMHVTNYAQTWPHHYKPVSIYSIANVETRGNKYSITDWYPDYIPVSSTSLDWNRMQPLTQEWAMMLSELLYLAETLTKYKAIPRKFSKVKRNGMTYVVGIHNRLKFLVYAKMNGF
jgi:hypothetical protein